MKKLMFGFICGVLAGWSAYWYVDHHKFQAWRTKQKVLNSAEKATQSLKDKMAEISTEAIKEQLAKTGVYIVEKAKEATAAVADATADARISATIKTRLFSDLGSAAMKINVDTSDGVVTLSGTAKTHDEVAKAVQTAMGTDGVRKVISTVQVKEGSP